MDDLQFDESDEKAQGRVALYVEDVIILLSLVLLFVLAVFCRHTWWGQAGLLAVLLVMAVVLFLRLRRVHRAFTGRDQDE